MKTPETLLSHEHEWIAHRRLGEPLPDAFMCKHCSLIIDVTQRAPGPTALEESAKKQTSSAGRPWGKSVIYGKEDEHATPYMTRYWIGRLRLHVFHRGDQDPDHHDHPWDFWTFPFTAYVEEVVHTDYGNDVRWTTRQVVPAWRLSFRPATHTHRVIGRVAKADDIEARVARVLYDRDVYTGPKGQHYVHVPGSIVTLVWRSKDKRRWGFLKHRDGQWCWVHWKSYVFGGGKHAPCE